MKVNQYKWTELEMRADVCNSVCCDDPEKFHVKACFAAFLHKLQVHVTPHPHPIRTHTGTDKICDITFHVPTIDV